MMLQLILLVLLTAWQAVSAGATVNVTVNVGDPRYYGPIDVGGYPAPQLAYPEPVVIERLPQRTAAEPLYIRVPPGHAKHWAKHCREYHACDRPVYFVRDDWYRNVYAPQYVARGKGHKDKWEKEEDKHERKEAKRAAKEHKHRD